MLRTNWLLVPSMLATGFFMLKLLIISQAVVTRIVLSSMWVSLQLKYFKLEISSFLFELCCIGRLIFGFHISTKISLFCLWDWYLITAISCLCRTAPFWRAWFTHLINHLSINSFIDRNMAKLLFLKLLSCVYLPKDKKPLFHFHTLHYLQARVKYTIPCTL